MESKVIIRLIRFPDYLGGQHFYTYVHMEDEVYTIYNILTDVEARKFNRLEMKRKSEYQSSHNIPRLKSAFSYVAGDETMKFLDEDSAIIAAKNYMKKEFDYVGEFEVIKES